MTMDLFSLKVYSLRNFQIRITSHEIEMGQLKCRQKLYILRQPKHTNVASLYFKFAVQLYLMQAHLKKRVMQ